MTTAVYYTLDGTVQHFHVNGEAGIDDRRPGCSTSLMHSCIMPGSPGRRLNCHGASQSLSTLPSSHCACYIAWTLGLYYFY